jgi:putative protein kinase ArgK-like GTPase of G3E family
MKWCVAFSSTLKTSTIGIVSVDPSKRKTGGALLGDRIRMNAIRNEQGVYAFDGYPPEQSCSVQIYS